ASHQESATVDRDQICFSRRWNNRRRTWLWIGARRLSQHQISTDTNSSDQKNQQNRSDDHEWCGFSLWRREVDDHLLLCWRRDWSRVCSPVRTRATPLHSSRFRIHRRRHASRQSVQPILELLRLQCHPVEFFLLLFFPSVSFLLFLAYTLLFLALFFLRLFNFLIQLRAADRARH